MIPESSCFSDADADSLRRARPSFSAGCAAELETAPPALQRYLAHYGFGYLLNVRPEVQYHLDFRHWHNYQIARHRWSQPAARARAVVVHGLFDHSGLYLPLVERLLREGYEVQAFDLPGHGLSSGTRTDIDTFHRYAAVLAACVDEIPTDKPLFALGQSTGCSVVMDLVLTGDKGKRLEKVVLLAPLVRVYGWAGIKLALVLLGRLIRRIPRRFGANSHDEVFLEFLAHRDPLQPRELSVTWVKAMRDWEKTFQRATEASTPALIIQGTNDKTVDWRSNLPLIASKFPDLKIRFVEGAMHHLVREADPWRTQALDMLCAWLNGMDS